MASPAMGLERSGFRAVLADRRRRVSKLGQMVLKRGRVSRAVLDEALARQATEGGRLGEILVDMGAISRLDLQAMLARQWLGRASAIMMACMVGLSSILPSPRVAEAAQASSTTLQISGYVPVRCELDLSNVGSGAAGADFVRVATFSHECNVDHIVRLNFDAQSLPDAASLQFQFGGKIFNADRTGQLMLGQSPAFNAARSDLLVKAQGLSAGQLAQVVQTIRVNVEPL
ncbi:hypothetical protein [Zavarzinia sp. CC-PAN008]|uniref:hypothetical protein n=1 Tax=Zavarzinia sp. CC-PAN008 TaxID=3243332 RepID=UPI003F746789